MFKAMRLDDNDNIFEMESFENREEAKAYVKKFEARGHKQTYWVETDSSSYPWAVSEQPFTLAQIEKVTEKMKADADQYLQGGIRSAWEEEVVGDLVTTYQAIIHCEDFHQGYHEALNDLLHKLKGSE